MKTKKKKKKSNGKVVHKPEAPPLTATTFEQKENGRIWHNTVLQRSYQDSDEEWVHETINCLRLTELLAVIEVASKAKDWRMARQSDLRVAKIKGEDDEEDYEE